MQTRTALRCLVALCDSVSITFVKEAKHNVEKDSLT